MPSPVRLIQNHLDAHVAALRLCRQCPGMASAPVSGGAVVSPVLIIGQAPGDKEPKLGRPFAWTAGKTLFRWLELATGRTEEQSRAAIYFAAVCRCFPGKKTSGGDRVPSPDEIHRCATWLHQEIHILKPALLIPVGKLAIEQFLSVGKLEDVVGKKFSLRYLEQDVDIIPLPHPSGASPWRYTPLGKKLLQDALDLLRQHPALSQR